MRKILLYCICVLWAVIVVANVLRLCDCTCMIALLNSVPEASKVTQATIKAAMYFVELLFILLTIVRGRTYRVVIIAAIATLLAGYVSTPMENVYMNALACCITIILFTKDQKQHYKRL